MVHEVPVPTERLSFRRISADDVDLICRLDRAEGVGEFLFREAPPRDEVVAEIERGFAQFGQYPMLGQWIVRVVETGEEIGWAALSPRDDTDASQPEVGYRLFPSAWGKGFATEASVALLHHAFALPETEMVWAQTMFVNTRSRRVMEKLGMRHVRTFYEKFDDPLPGTELGEVEYQITRDEWEAQRA